MVESKQIPILEILYNEAKRIANMLSKETKENTHKKIELLHSDLYSSLSNWFGGQKQRILSKRGKEPIDRLKNRVVKRIGEFTERILNEVPESKMSNEKNLPPLAESLLEKLVVYTEDLFALKEGYNDCYVFYYKNDDKAKNDLEKVVSIVKKDTLDCDLVIRFGKIKDQYIFQTTHDPFFLAFLFNRTNEEKVYHLIEKANISYPFRKKEIGEEGLISLLEKTNKKNSLNYSLENGILVEEEDIFIE